MESFAGKSAIVTGGASGIGRGLCEALAARGAAVTVADLDFAGAQAVAKGIARSGGSASAVALDVADIAAFTRLVESAPQLDYLFNNAGFAILGESRDMAFEDWRRIVDVNLMGVIAGSLAAYKRMATRGEGHIVNIASLAGLAGFPVFTAYSTTKAGVVMLSQMLRAEGESLGVRVSVVCPGFIRTGIYDHATYLGVRKEQALAQNPFPVMDLVPAIEGILAGVARNDAVIVLPGYARFLWRLLRWFPFAAIPFWRKVMRDFRAIRTGT